MMLRYRFDREAEKRQDGDWVARSRFMGLLAYGKTKTAALNRLDEMADFFVQTYSQRHGYNALRAWFDLHTVPHFLSPEVNDGSEAASGNDSVREQTERDVVLV